MTPLRIFIGFDSREPSAYHVLSHSILRRASIPVAITPLVQPALRKVGLYTRERGPTESTEFSLTRFLVPFLSGFEGVSVFMDSDMLCLADVAELAMHAQYEGSKTPAVWVAQHDYTPKDATKFLGQQQTTYPRKNWSSLMIFSNPRCAALTPAYVNKASGLELHRFHYLTDARIGSLPLEWNHLVGEDGQSPAPPKLVHFTNGGPWFAATQDVPYADHWRDELAHLLGGT